MGVFTDDFIVLTDANPAAQAYGRSLYFNRASIVAFYRREDDPNMTNVFTADGKSYVVKESVNDIYDQTR